MLSALSCGAFAVLVSGCIGAAASATPSEPPAGEPTPASGEVSPASGVVEPGEASAQKPTSAQQEAKWLGEVDGVKLELTDDAGVLEDYEYAKLGGEPLATTWLNKGIQRTVYFRFDTSRISDPSQISEASFGVTSTTNLKSAVWGYLDGEPRENWAEAELDWATAFGTDGEGGRDPESTVYLGSLEQEPNGNRWVLRNDKLVNFLKQDTNRTVTLVVQAQDRAWDPHRYAMKENPDLPPASLRVKTAP